MSSSVTPSAATTQAQGRITAFDAFRGIAILCVIFGHTTPYGWAYQFNPERQTEFWLAVTERNLMLPCLPLFLFLSGYLLGNTRCSNWAEYTSFLSKRVSRVAIPFLFWSVVFLGLSWAFAVSYTPVDAVLRILTGRADGAFYFILLIIQFYLLTPLFSRVLDWRYGIHALFFLHLLAIGVLYIIQLLWWPNMPYEVAKTPVFGWLSIFPMGMYLRRNPGAADRVSLGGAALAAVAFFAITQYESTLLLPKGTFELAISDLRFMALAYGYAVILVFLKLVDVPWPKVLVSLGGMSFGIFFIHGFILRRVGSLLPKLVPAIAEHFFLFQVSVTLLTLALCVAVILACRRLLPESVTSRLLAF